MRIRWTALACLLVLGIASTVMLSLTYGQDSKPPIPPPPGLSPPDKTPTAAPKAATPPLSVPGAKAAPARDLEKLSPLHRQMYLSAKRGAEWLYRMNKRPGRFEPGLLPAVNARPKIDHPLRQAGAAFALARTAAYFADADQAARVKQTLLTLLEDTAVDKNDKSVRYPSLPAGLVNRLSMAALIVLAINELPAPGEELLNHSEQLCNFIRKQQQDDGSLKYESGAAGAADPDGVNHYPGQALYALARSHRHRPAKWKAEAVRKALPHYLKLWRENKNRDFVSWQTAAYTEAYLLTKDKAFADAVLEMNDWLCGLQHDRLDPAHPRRLGSFMDIADGKQVPGAADVYCAPCAESLAEACRVTRELGDVTRHERYTAALERCLQFLTTLQFAEADTQHFADWYRPRLVGGFHASHHDGTLRIEYTQHAASALVQYLRHVARI